MIHELSIRRHRYARARANQFHPQVKSPTDGYKSGMFQTDMVLLVGAFRNTLIVAGRLVLRSSVASELKFSWKSGHRS